MDHDMQTHAKPESTVKSRAAWTSRTGIVTIAFLLIAAFFLFSEHRAHAFGILPFLLLAACPFLHIFMHRGHGGHGGSHGRHDGRGSNASDDLPRNEQSNPKPTKGI
jgi:hypothetical protein